jgi:hypothetical protein
MKMDIRIMTNIVTILVETLMNAKEELAKAKTFTAVELAKMKVKNTETKLDRMLCMADL